MAVTRAELIIGGYLVGGTVLGYGAYKVLQKLGVFPTKESKEEDEAIEAADASATVVNPKNPFLAFNPNYRFALAIRWKRKYGKYGPFSPTYQFRRITKASILATRLKQSKGTFNDDEEMIYSVFRAMLTQYQLSFVSQIFQQVYKQDLLQFLKAMLSPEEMVIVLNMVKKYPLYYVPKK